MIRSTQDTQKDNSTAPLLRVVLVIGITLLVAGCVEVPPPEDTPTPTTTPEVTVATETTPTMAAVVAPLDLVTYRHKTGVFSISQPADWEVIDSSTDRQLSVRFIPPPGFGSRVMLEVTNEGVLDQDQLHQKAESFIALTFGANESYHEAGRSDLPDGRIQGVYDYDDRRGGRGTETVTFQGVGPFLVVLRVFMAAPDEASLRPTLERIASSLIIDPQAPWGTSVAAINPAELIINNTYLWTSGSITYYMGEVYNASPAAAMNVEVQVTLCDSSGVALAPLITPLTLKVLDRGGSLPFMISAERLPRGVDVCSEQATGVPAPPDPYYTTALGLTVEPFINTRGRLELNGQAANPGLDAIKNLHVVMIVYNELNQVVGLGTLDSDAEVLLLPGQAWPIHYTFEVLGGKADHYVTLGEAQVVPDSNPSLSP